MGADHVIPEMSLRALRGEDPFRVPGADQYRAFCHVDDAVEAMIRLMDHPGGGRRRSCTSATTRAETNIGDLAKLVLRITGARRDAARRCRPRPARSPAAAPTWPGCAALTGYEPTVPLEEGVRRTVRLVPGRSWPR